MCGGQRLYWICCRMLLQLLPCHASPRVPPIYIYFNFYFSSSLLVLHTRNVCACVCASMCVRVLIRRKKVTLAKTKSSLKYFILLVLHTLEMLTIAKNEQPENHILGWPYTVNTLYIRELYDECILVSPYSAFVWILYHCQPNSLALRWPCSGNTLIYSSLKLSAFKRLLHCFKLLIMESRTNKKRA